MRELPGKNIPGKNIPGKNIPGKNIPGKIIHRGVALLAVMLLAGCGEPATFEDLEHFVSDAGMDMRGKVEAPRLPELIPADDFKGTGPVRQPFDLARLDAPAKHTSPTQSPLKRINR